MRVVFIFWLLVLVTISCNSSKTISSKPPIEKENKPGLTGVWQLEFLFASDNNWTSQPFINLNLKDNSFSGNSGCNNISGKFIIKDNYIAIDKNIISTKMACSGTFEKSFLSALTKINKCTIHKDYLELGQGEIVLMKFKRN